MVNGFRARTMVMREHYDLTELLKRPDIPKDAKTLLLPEDPRIYIMAMTTSQQVIKIHSNQFLIDKFDF